MGKFKKVSKSISLNIDSERMNPLQLRLLKKLCIIAVETSQAFGEAEYFGSSAEMMKLTSEIIKNSSYNDIATQNENIPYKQQALEYAMDVFQDSLEEEIIPNEEF